MGVKSEFSGGDPAMERIESIAVGKCGTPPFFTHFPTKNRSNVSIINSRQMAGS